jgi:hypothetical protein
MTKEPLAGEAPQDGEHVDVDVNAATAPAFRLSDAHAAITVALADLDPRADPEELAGALRQLDPAGFDLDLHGERMLALLESHRSVHGVTVVHRVAHEILQVHFRQKAQHAPDN